MRKLQAWLDQKKREEDLIVASVGNYRANEVPENIKDRNKWKKLCV